MTDNPLPSPITDHTAPAQQAPHAPTPPPVPESMLPTPGGVAGDGLAIDASRGYAGVGSRIVAALIDGLILFIPSLVLNFIVPVLGGIVVAWLYSAKMHSSERQATFGRQAMGIIMTNEQGGRVSFGQATGQFFATFVSALTLGIGYLMMFFTAKKQGLHDMMAGTLHYYRAN
jgi:uncharacterized RDD family membrane protein YckC